MNLRTTIIGASALCLTALCGFLCYIKAAMLLPFCGFPIVITLLLALKLKHWSSQIILLLSLPLFAWWCAYDAINAAFINPDAQSGLVIAFLGIFSLVVMIPAWVIALILNALYIKKDPDPETAASMPIQEKFPAPLEKQ